MHFHLVEKLNVSAFLFYKNSSKFFVIDDFDEMVLI